MSEIDEIRATTAELVKAIPPDQGAFDNQIHYAALKEKFPDVSDDTLRSEMARAMRLRRSQFMQGKITFDPKFPACPTCGESDQTICICSAFPAK